MNGQATLHFSHTKVKSPSTEQRRWSSKVFCVVVSALFIVLVGVNASGTQTTGSQIGHNGDAFETDMRSRIVTSHGFDVRRQSHCALHQHVHKVLPRGKYDGLAKV